MKTFTLLSSFIVLFLSLAICDIDVGVLSFEYLPHWKYMEKNVWSGFYGNLLSALESEMNIK